jgi:hypothetical protein
MIFSAFRELSLSIPPLEKTMPISSNGRLRLNTYQSAVRTAAKERDIFTRDQDVARYRALIRTTTDEKRKHELALLIREEMHKQRFAS